jgi:hypothetical protein
MFPLVKPLKQVAYFVQVSIRIVVVLKLDAIVLYS